VASAMGVASRRRGCTCSGGSTTRAVRYPFFSADSTNVARNHAGTNGGRAKKSALRMASEIDARQTPARWHRVAVAEELAA
jgi:hypothetical protein